MLYLAKLESPCVELGGPPDGCALFYRRSRFQLRGMKSHFYTSNVPGSLETDVNAGLSSQNAIFACLYDVLEAKQLVVVTTHLKARYGTEIEITRNYQVLELLKELEEFRCKYGTVHPVIVCGDFNGNSSEELYTSMLKSSLNFSSVYNSSSREDCRKSTESEKNANLLYSDYEPAYTTWKFRDDGVEKLSCIDYIWISESTAQLMPFEKRVLPSISDIGPSALPCLKYPSDHLSLACKVAWTSL